MNLNELVNSIKANPKTLSVVDLPSEDFGFYLFKRLTYKTSDSTAEQTAICIIVKDREQPTETAFYKGTAPTYLSTPATSFKDEVTAQINTYKASMPNLESYEVTRVNSEFQIAEVTAYIYDSTAKTSVANKFIVAKVSGEWKVRKLA